MAPLQVAIIPVADRHLEYAGQVRDQLAAAGLRIELDDRQEKIGYKIREAQLQKIPYMLVIGDKEMEAGTVAPRARDGQNLGAIPVEQFIALVQDMCEKKK